MSTTRPLVEFGHSRAAVRRVLAFDRPIEGKEAKWNERCVQRCDVSSPAVPKSRTNNRSFISLGSAGMDSWPKEE